MAMKSTNLNSPLGRPCKPLEVAHVPGDDIENGAVRPLVTRKHSSRIPKVAHEHRNANAVVIPAMLPDKGQISFRQRVQPNQLSLISGEGEQFKAL